MSAGPGEAPEAIELPQGDAAFSSLMDLLVADEAGAPAGAGGPETGAAAAGGGAPAGEGAGAAGETGGAPDLPVAGEPGSAGTGAAPAAGGGDAGGAGDPGGVDGAAAGGTGQAGADATGGGAADLPAGWTVEHTVVAPQLAELSTKLEEKVAETYQQSALAEVREEHGPYFEALEKHPRLLVGTQVPAIGKEGFETIKDTADAREWQDAVKGLLVEEIRDRAGRELEANSGDLSTLHASIELFQKNADLVPGTKTFDRALADRFAAMVKPYEHRVDGKLQGYSIPVQPIIDQLRAQVQSERATAVPAASPAPAASAAARVNQRPPADPPQAGIPSKSGASAEAGEDFGALFGTLGLPNFRI